MQFKILFTIAVYFFSTINAQYDDISVLGEVLERSTVESTVEGSGVEESTTNVDAIAKNATTTSKPTTVKAAVTQTTTEQPSSTSSTTTPTTTTTTKTTTNVETTTTEKSTTATTTTEITTEVPTTTTKDEVPTTTEEATSTENVLVTESPVEAAEVDEDSFLGFKKPDLATIYRRLFPFQQDPGRISVSRGSF